MVFSPDITLAEKLLDVATFRHQVISHNIANANTPKYKRLDVSFEEALSKIMKEDDSSDDTNLFGMEVDVRNSALDSKKTLEQLKIESESDLGIVFTKANAAFNYQWASNSSGDYIPPSISPPQDKSSIINSLKPELVVDKKAGRLDGNNVSVDLEIGRMIKNTTLYNVLVSSISTEFRILKSIITMR